jgi:hypothetical protein
MRVCIKLRNTDRTARMGNLQMFNILTDGEDHRHEPSNGVRTVVSEKIFWPTYAFTLLSLGLLESELDYKNLYIEWSDEPVSAAAFYMLRRIVVSERSIIDYRLGEIGSRSHKRKVSKKEVASLADLLTAYDILGGTTNFTDYDEGRIYDWDVLTKYR